MKKIITIAALLAMGTGVVAQEKVPSHLDQWIQASFENFPNIRSAKLQQQLAEDYVQYQKGNLLPTVSGTANYHYLYPAPSIQFPGSDLAFQPFPNHNYSVAVQARQLITDFGRTESEVKKAQTSVEQSALQTEEVKEQLAYEISRLYLNLAFVEKSIEVQNANIQVLEETEKLVQSRIKNGDALDLDLLNVQVQLENSRNQRKDFQNAEEKLLASIAYLTGTDPINISKDESALNWTTELLASKSMEESFESNTAVKLAKTEEEIASTELHTAEASHMPSLYVDAAAGFKNGYLPLLDETKFNYSAGITLSVPIYHGKKLNRQQEMARKKLDIAKLSTENTESSLHKEWRQVLADIETNQEKLNSSQTLIQQAERALEIAKAQYKHGVITYVDLQNANNALLQARLTQLHNRYQLSNAQLEALRLQSEHFWQEG
ncbi:TolC family protein [Limibacter armeniacum]|uniref:TolC family protein n=1 Tax=Limibacter armeniacum TaxID=466084 RepID=UPI002FE69BFC